MKPIRMIILAAFGVLPLAACCPGYYPDNDHYHHDAAPVGYEPDRTGPHDYYPDDDGYYPDNGGGGADNQTYHDQSNNDDPHAYPW